MVRLKSVPVSDWSRLREPCCKKVRSEEEALVLLHSNSHSALWVRKMVMGYELEMLIMTKTESSQNVSLIK